MVRSVVMARLIRAIQRPCISSSPSLKTLVPSLQHHHQQCQNPLPQSRNAAPPFFFQTRAAHAAEIPKSIFDSNILRILRNEIQYQYESAPPQESVTTFKSFSIEDCPGERWIRLGRQFGENEDIKIEVTMFDGCAMVPKPGDDSDDGRDMRLHSSLLVDISKTDSSEDAMEFMCSAWPDCLEIQKVYMLRRDHLTSSPYLGPDFGNLDEKVRTAFQEFLEERGVNDELSIFLHEYMLNKDRLEFIKWLGNVQSFVEK